MIPDGYCQCGCGEPTDVAAQTKQVLAGGDGFEVVPEGLHIDHLCRNRAGKSIRAIERELGVGRPRIRRLLDAA